MFILSSCNNEETNEAKITFQDHDFFYQLFIKHGKISHARPVAKKERMNLGVTFSFFSNSKHSKTTEANYQSLKQFPISFLFTHLGENQSLKEKVIERT